MPGEGDVVLYEAVDSSLIQRDTITRTVVALLLLQNLWDLGEGSTRYSECSLAEPSKCSTAEDGFKVDVLATAGDDAVVGASGEERTGSTYITWARSSPGMFCKKFLDIELFLVDDFLRIFLWIECIMESSKVAS